MRGEQLGAECAVASADVSDLEAQGESRHLASGQITHLPHQDGGISEWDSKSGVSDQLGPGGSIQGVHGRSQLAGRSGQADSGVASGLTVEDEFADVRNRSPEERVILPRTTSVQRSLVQFRELAGKIGRALAANGRGIDTGDLRAIERRFVDISPGERVIENLRAGDSTR